MEKEELDEWFENKKQELEELNKDKKSPQERIEEKLDNIESLVFAITMLILVYFGVKVIRWLFNS